MAVKPVKTKEAEKVKPVVADKTKLAKPGPAKLVAAPVKAVEKSKEKIQPKKPGKIATWWRETIGELRKVTWPTVPEARRMTGIVLMVMAATALVLGLLDFIFSRLIGLLVSL